MQNRTKYIWICILCGVLSLSGCEVLQSSKQQASESQVIVKSPKDTRLFKSLTLGNAMEVVLVQDMNSEISAVSLAIDVGSYQNPPQQQGLAHYLEHMLFLGTEKYPEPNSLQQFIDHNSGKWNAYTAQDHTNYFFSLPTVKLDRAMDMFSDYFKAPLFDLHYSEKELNAIHSEWSMGRSQDGRILHSLNGVTGNPEHPGSLLAVGNKETLSDKPDSKLNEELLAFFQKYYSANLMKLAIVSNLPLDQQEKLARKYFASVKNKQTPAPKIDVPGMTQEQMGKKIHYASVMDLKMLMIHFPMPDNSAFWRSKPNEYIVNLLASEEPGTVAQQLREKNLAKALYANVEPDSYGMDGSFNVYVELTDYGMTRRDEVIASVFAYIDLIRKQGVDEKYFNELREIYQKKFANLEMQQPLQAAISLSSTLLKHEAPDLLVHPFIFDHFDAQAVNRVLDIMTPQRARIWYISQKEPATKAVPFHEGKYDIAPIVEKDLKTWQTMAKAMSFKLPEENPLFSAGDQPVVAPTILSPENLRSEDGLEVWLTHSEYYQGQKGRLDIVLQSKHLLENARQAMLADVFVAILNSQQMSLQDRARQAGIGLSFSHRSSDFIVSLSEFNAKHKLLAGQMFEMLSEWDVSPEDFSKAKDSIRQQLLNREKTPPFRQVFDLLRRQVQLQSWSRDAEKEALESITLSDVKAFYRQLMADNRLRVFAYGNYNKDTVLAITDTVLSALPASRKPQVLFVPAYKVPVEGTLLSYAEQLDGHTDNALIEMYVATDRSFKARATAATLNALIKNTFFTELRTNEQFGYVVGTMPARIDDYAGIAFFVQSNTRTLPEIKARIDTFRTTFIDELMAVDDAVVGQIVQSELDQLTKKPADYSEEMRPLIADFYDAKLDYDSRQNMIDAFKQVTKDDLVNLYKGVIAGSVGMRVLVQAKGTQFTDSAFAEEQ